MQKSVQIKNCIELVIAEDKQQTMMSEAFTIAGNTQTMMALQRFIEHFGVDLEGLMANYIGQIPAHQLAAVVKVGQQLVSDQYQSQLSRPKIICIMKRN